MTDENENVIKSGWYWTEYREFEVRELYDSDLFETPEEAVENAKSCLSEETKICVVFYTEKEINISNYMNGMVGLINESLVEMQDEDGAGPFNCTDEEEESLDRALKKAADQWQKRHKRTFVFFEYDIETMKEILVNPVKAVAEEAQSC